jgi:hypothetical protein
MGNEGDMVTLLVRFVFNWSLAILIEGINKERKNNERRGREEKEESVTKAARRTKEGDKIVTVLLRHYATNRKVAGSIPDEVNF